MSLEDEARRIYKRINQDREKAERYLLYTKDEQRKYHEARATYIAAGKTSPELQSFKPTERTAVRDVDFIRASEAYRWLRAVEILERSMVGAEKIFLAARRAAAAERGRGIGRPNWVIRTQRKYYDAMEGETLNGEESWLSEDQVKRWWKKIVAKTCDIAVRLEK